MNKKKKEEKKKKYFHRSFALEKREREEEKENISFVSGINNFLVENSMFNFVIYSFA